MNQQLYDWMGESRKSFPQRWKLSTKTHMGRAKPSSIYTFLDNFISLILAMNWWACIFCTVKGGFDFLQLLSSQGGGDSYYMHKQYMYTYKCINVYLIYLSQVKDPIQ